MHSTSTFDHLGREVQVEFRVSPVAHQRLLAGHFYRHCVGAIDEVTIEATALANYNDPEALRTP
jgi:hypothetical protein